MNDIERLMKGLDKWRPNWALEYADGQDLYHYARDCEMDMAMDRLRGRVANKLIIVVAAALEVGIVVSRPNP